MPILKCHTESKAGCLNKMNTDMSSEATTNRRTWKFILRARKKTFSYPRQAKTWYLSGSRQYHDRQSIRMILWGYRVCFSHVTRKPGVCDQVRLKLACSATQTSIARVLKFCIQQVKVHVLYYLGSEKQRHWSDCADAQAYLHLCCCTRHKQVFLWHGFNTKIWKTTNYEIVFFSRLLKHVYLGQVLLIPYCPQAGNPLQSV